jgi:putative FmdB family regulatory protein
MPLYTYACDSHGEFAAWGTLATSDAPQPCPACAEPAKRALAHPAIGGRGTDESAMGACDMGDCGAGEAPAVGGHVCGAGCAH